MTQTWTIGGRTMNLAQLNKWKEEKGISEPTEEKEPELKPVMKQPQSLTDKGLVVTNSTEEAFNALLEKRWANLNREERKLYKMYKEQLGK